MPIAALRAESGLSKTRLVSRFREQIGVSPKRYARVLRFRRALALLHGGALPVEVALAAGYYDQPHMIADFRAMAGMTPPQFATARRYAQSLSTAPTPPACASPASCPPPRPSA